MKRISAFLIGLALSFAVLAQTTVPFYADGLWNNTVVPSAFNGVAANTVPELWSFSTIFTVQYPGPTTVKLSGGTVQYCNGRAGCSVATTTISTTGVLIATPTLLSSTSGGAPFTVYANGTTYGFYLDAGLTMPIPTDVYGNPIDPLTAGTGSFVQPDGTTATAPTAGTAYVSCPSCSNLPNYTMPCNVPDSTQPSGLRVVYAPDCESDPVNYYGPPITTYVQTCGTPQTTDPTSGEVTQNFQQCAPTWSGGPASISHYTYLTGAYTAGAAVVDPATGLPITLTCTNSACAWSGALSHGNTYLLVGSGTDETCYRGICSDNGTAVLRYSAVVPSKPVPPSPPPKCGTPSTPPCDDGVVNRARKQ